MAVGRMRHRSQGGRNWLTAARARAYATPLWVLSLVFVAGLSWRIASPALTDARHRIAPTDFSALWAGARLAAQGRPAAAYDPLWAQAQQCQQAECDPAAPFPRPYLYPPVFLLLTLPFGALPLAVALPIFVGVGHGLLALCLRRLTGARWWLPILLSPGALLDVVAGQTGLLAASCFAGGLLCIGSRPGLAGAILGVLVFKPQLGLGLPVLLVAGRQWRALAACGGTAAGLCALSWAVLGSAAWQAFFDRFPVASALLRHDAVWPKLASVYGAARMLGSSASAAAVLQGGVAVLVLGWLAWLVRRPPLDQGRMAALVPAALLCTPYLWDYDLVCLTVPAAWVAGEAQTSGWRPWEPPVLCVLYVLPMLSRAAGLGLGLPLSPFVAAGVLWLICGRLDDARHVRNMVGPDQSAVLTGVGRDG